MDFPSKLPEVGVTVFTVMTELANQRGAINLAQGFPDFACDPALVDLVTEHMRAGHNQYAPMQGVSGLREAIAEKIARLYGANYDPATEITVTSGATEALFCAISAFVHSGDEVILFEPCYDSYAPVIRLNGGVPVFVTLRFPDYRVDWDEVRRAITGRTRLLIINTPHNPTGTLLSATDLAALARVVEGTNLIVVADEVYEHILFDGARHESVARTPALVDRGVVINSFGKTYHTTGWKIGYAAAPAAITAELRRVHQFVTFSSHTPSQLTYADVVRDPRTYETLGAFYQHKRDLFLSLLAGSRFRAVPCRGTYFQLLDYSGISDERDSDFALRLLEEHGVAAIPTSAFLYRSDPPPVLRFCFAKKDETLEAAASRLRAI